MQTPHPEMNVMEVVSWHGIQVQKLSETYRQVDSPPASVELRDKVTRVSASPRLMVWSLSLLTDKDEYELWTRNTPIQLHAGKYIGR